jgi:hypothetical protein
MAGNTVEGKAEQGGDVAVGYGATVTTATRPVGLGDSGASALARRKAAATLLALGVVRALDEDRLL